MKTSSISLRVADFLKGYPPFNFMEEEDLLRLAGSGRVKFHESEEIVFEEGLERESWFYVIQKGTVNLFKKNGKREELTDVRVEGNLLGMLWDLDTDVYLSTARTTSDTILYRLPLDPLIELAEKIPKVKAFLKSYYSKTPGSEEANEGINEAPSDWLKYIGPAKERAARNLLTCSANDPIKSVARAVAPGCQEAVVVVDSQRRPIGVITESDLSGKVATGDIAIDAPASALMSSPVVTIKPGLTAGELLLKMLHFRVHHLCVTADGTDQTPIIGILTERNLSLLHGRLPTILTNEIQVAKTTEELAKARERTDELVFYYLETEAPIPWIASFVAEIDGAITERALDLAQEKLSRRGQNGPGTPFCWLAFHSEGRRERLLRSPQRSGIIFTDPDQGTGEATAAYYRDLACEVRDILKVCGFLLEPNERRADNPRWCRPLSTWKGYYTAWIKDPIENEILRQTPFFDLRIIAGEKSLGDELIEHIQSELGKHPNFIPLLANDAMENLPPVTIFRDSVMDKSGMLWSSIDTKAHALYPMVDLARVMALQFGLSDTTSTIERFQKLKELVPEEAKLFGEAAEAFQFALLIQTRFGLSRGDEGQFIRPGELNLIQKEQIKTLFRTVARLLEFAAERFGLVPISEEK
ncbi:DUF294 nucleotidyltransferase-like domain-containing protein [Rubellicoccus peritrichatus]|uniref:DUF294 nucleotidyltransferase-like domain-containing protein n=1 Tax=Rubellicoccus peritrichatus TaxID=3080537 RepID=A0AAQ3LDY5_9BACT|nr:DUF294 nucleotidyltransferase-like domain-containing protein [Puniceicoccus sp. CR14]WOO42160.1 DUF294 nucleotidyltransferase-like domain-containing protein [Puniceicoccus sp. CR14]